MKYKKYEKHVCEKYTAQKSKHALQYVILERAVGANESGFSVHPSVLDGGNDSAPKMFNLFFVSAGI